MNIDLFLSIVAWGVLVVSGLVNLLHFLQIAIHLTEGRGKIIIKRAFFVWLFLSILSLAYLIAS